jgi:hypothetical protein
VGKNSNTKAGTDSDAKQKYSDIKEHYSKWLYNKSVEELKRDFVKVGYPLELAVRYILKKRRYAVTNAFYQQLSKDGNSVVQREIDIYASKSDIETSKDCQFSFKVILIGDCKYSSTNDFFAFESKYMTNTFSIPFNCKSLLQTEVGIEFPMVIDKISEVDVADRNFHPKNLVIYDAAEQVLNSLVYFYKKHHEDLKNNYSEINKRLNDGTRRESSDSQVNAVNNLISSGQFGKIVKDIKIIIAIPIIFIDKNNGLIQVLTSQGTIEDLVDIGFGIYEFVPRTFTADQKPILTNSELPISKFPIIICNLSKLEECLDVIDQNIDFIKLNFIRKWESHPELLYKEITDYMSHIPQPFEEG